MDSLLKLILYKFVIDLCAMYDICMAFAINDINKLGYDGLANEIHSGPMGMIPDCNRHDDVLTSVGLFCAGYSGYPCADVKTCAFKSWPKKHKLRSEKKLEAVLLELQIVVLKESISHKHYQPTALVGCAQNITCGEEDVVACSAAFL
ncbi:unnamed protein product [Cylicocyclus nassatus]|uniref:Uncharacterized protein n=1 Tax=Cylicocyclus nassatus TaxID=53992 RepID=A0AA36GTV9_CYLNA|nr:unnamed protein product [Cylicocyclus nassatus]